MAFYQCSFIVYAESTKYSWQQWKSHQVFFHELIVFLIYFFVKIWYRNKNFRLQSLLLTSSLHLFYTVMSSFIYSGEALETNVWPMLECLWTRMINICLSFQPPLPKTHHHSSPTTTLLIYPSTLESPNITSTNLHHSRTQDIDHRVSLKTLIFSRFAKNELVYIC
ncbi:hypothetical protein Hanom_Chr15g01342271 [Helianthus anomalus]